MPDEKGGNVGAETDGDGGNEEGENREGETAEDDRFEAYRAARRHSSLERLSAAPVAFVREYPAASLLLTVPLGAAVAAALVLAGQVDVGAGPVRSTVGLVVVPFLLAAVPYGYAYERKRRHDRTVRERFPAALEILADADENDLPLGDAFRLVSRRTSGVLESEFDRIARDYALTSDGRGALERFADRLDVPAVTRVVRLLDDGFRATNDLAPVLELVADDLDTRNTIRGRQRRNMHPYVLLVVLGVAVYAAILVLMETQFLPVAQDAARQAGGRLSRLGLEAGAIPAETYGRLFFHSALIQAVGNGLLLGKFRDNRLASGVKYAAGLTVLVLAVFLPFA